jgi:hypothetical protein
MVLVARFPCVPDQNERALKLRRDSRSAMLLLLFSRNSLTFWEFSGNNAANHEFVQREDGYIAAAL